MARDNLADINQKLGALTEANMRSRADREETRGIIENGFANIRSDLHSFSARLDSFEPRIFKVEEITDRWEGFRKGLMRILLTYGITGLVTAGSIGAIVDHIVTLMGVK